MTTKLTVRTLTLPDGTSVPVALAGDPAGPPILLLHGYTDSWRSYEEILEGLPAGHFAVAPTYRGHGDADRPASGYTVDGLVADVVAVLDQLGIDRAFVVGHSLGATVALRLAVDHPERVTGVVLEAAFAGFAANPGVQELAAVVAELVDPVDPELAEEFQAGTIHQPIAPERFATFVAETRKVSAHVWRGVMEGLLNDDVLWGVETIAVPTTLLWGAHDAYVARADQDVIAGLVPGARIEVYEDAGHALHWEQPTRFVADIERLARGVSCLAS
jgi:pimeloyl-ACP methyl ester carboxylesterase